MNEQRLQEIENEWTKGEAVAELAAEVRRLRGILGHVSVDMGQVEAAAFRTRVEREEEIGRAWSPSARL